MEISHVKESIVEVVKDYKALIDSCCTLSQLTTEKILMDIQKEYDKNHDFDISNVYIKNMDYFRLLDDIVIMKPELCEVEHEIDLKQLIDLIYRFYSYSLQDHQINFISTVRDLKVKFNMIDLFSVLQEIIQNAMEHGFSKDIGRNKEKRITLSTYYNSLGKLCLAISNNGSPVQYEIADRIFDPYFSTIAMGRGKGLWNIKQSLAKYGAEIVCETAGDETRFIITFN